MPDERSRRPAAPLIATSLLLVAVWAFFLRNAFDVEHSFALDMDNEFFIGTVLSAMSGAFSQGAWPLRMDTVLGGVPLYNSPQLSPFYPFYLASLPIFQTPGEVVHSMHWVTLAHLLVLEINTYVFLRVIGTSRLAALLGAALFAFSANSQTYAAWLNITAPYSWFPLYLAGLVGVFKHPGRPLYPATALVSVVLLALASPAQPLIHAVLVSAVFVVVHWGSQGSAGGWKQTKGPLATLAVVAAAAILIVAPVLIPATIEFKDMIRWIGPFPPVIGNARIPFEAFQFDQLSIPRLAGVFFRQEGAAVGSPFVGVLALALAAVAAVSCFQSWITRALLVVAVYAIVSSTGSHLGLAQLNYHVPLLNKIREPSRFLVLFQFAIAAPAAKGIDELRRRMQSDAAVNPTRERAQLIALWATAATGLLLLGLRPEGVVAVIPPWVSLLSLAALIVAFMAARRRPSRTAGLVVASLWAGCALAMLATEVRWVPAPVSASKYSTGGGHALDEVLDRIVRLDPERNYRVVFDGGIDKQMAAMLASYKNVRTLSAYFNPAPFRQFEELYYHGPRSTNYFQALGARYLVCADSCSAEATRGYALVERIGRLNLYEDGQAIPHSRLQTTSDGIFTGLDDYIRQLASADLSRGLLYLEPEDAGILGTGTSTSCTSHEESRTDVGLRVLTQCAVPGAVIVNKFYDKSWKASVDGQRTKLLRVNGNQMAVAVSPGEHVVQLRYRPASFLLSIPVSIAGLVLAIVGIAFLRSRRRRAS